MNKMEIHKILPSREERWDELKDSGHEKVLHWIRYDQFHYFLKKEPKLFMFVPCDYKGNMLEMPRYSIVDGVYELSPLAPMHNRITDEDMRLADQYQEALDRVIFDGFRFEIDGWSEGYCGNLINGDLYIYVSYYDGAWRFEDEDEVEYKTLADLSRKVELNINGQKQAGL